MKYKFCFRKFKDLISNEFVDAYFLKTDHGLLRSTYKHILDFLKNGDEISIKQLSKNDMKEISKFEVLRNELI